MLNGSHMDACRIYDLTVVHLFMCIFYLEPRSVNMLRAPRYLNPALGICLTHQITHPCQVPVATVVSNLLEHFILSSISPFLGTTDNQFGFKAGHSRPTGHSTLSLKQTASYFVTHGSSCAYCVFICLESIRSTTAHDII